MTLSFIRLCSQSRMQNRFWYRIRLHSVPNSMYILPRICIPLSVNGSPCRSSFILSSIGVISAIQQSQVPLYSSQHAVVTKESAKDFIKRRLMGMDTHMEAQSGLYQKSPNVPPLQHQPHKCFKAAKQHFFLAVGLW